MNLTAVIHEAEEGGYWAECVEVPEAASQGESVAECLENLREATEMLLDYRREVATKNWIRPPIWNNSPSMENLRRGGGSPPSKRF
jgi:predicted RNase H-like HicB family nuclease